MKQVNIYTQVSHKSPRKQNGFGIFVLEYQTHSGAVTLNKLIKLPEATPNQAEMLIFLCAISCLHEKCILEIHTESPYLAAGLQDRAKKWQENGWKTNKGEEVANKEEWQKLLNFLCGNELHVITKQPHPYRGWMAAELEKEERRDEGERV